MYAFRCSRLERAINYYPFHIGDYASATRHLSWEEDCAYRRMLDVYYTTEKPLPLDLRAVFRLIMATTDQQREAAAIVLREFFVEGPSGWESPRAEAEIKAAAEQRQKQRDKANKRWHGNKSEHGNAQATPQHEDTHAAASHDDAKAMPPIPIPIPIEEKETTSASLPKSRASRSKLLGVQELKAEGVDPKHAEDWLAVRRVKKAPLTQTAWESVKAQAEIAGFTPAQAVQHAAESGWQGFKAAWLRREDALSGGSHGVAL